MGKLDVKDFQEIKSVMVGELLAETCSKLSIANLQRLEFVQRKQ